MEVTTPAPARLRFGLYELDPDLYELRRDGTLIGLQRQPCRLLYLLASRSGEVVGRDDIRAALWPEERAGEFDVRINFCLARIREALHEDAANPRFIKTVRGRGYCFLAPLREEAAAEPGLPAAGSPPNPAARGGRAVGTVGQVGAEGCEIHPVAARPRQTTRRARPGWGTRGPQPGRAFKRVEWRSHSGPRANQSSDRAGAQGVPSPVERQAGRVAKPLGVPRQSSYR
ncbi:MAG TPA: winged helix-turn-helix domain-containing protein [Terriglobales bacterium]